MFKIDIESVILSDNIFDKNIIKTIRRFGQKREHYKRMEKNFNGSSKDTTKLCYYNAIISNIMENTYLQYAKDVSSSTYKNDMFKSSCTKKENGYTLIISENPYNDNDSSVYTITNDKSDFVMSVYIKHDILYIRQSTLDTVDLNGREYNIDYSIIRNVYKSYDLINEQLIESSFNVEIEAWNRQKIFPCYSTSEVEDIQRHLRTVNAVRSCIFHKYNTVWHLYLRISKVGVQHSYFFLSLYYIY